jgi:hypothetical protein
VSKKYCVLFVCLFLLSPLVYSNFKPFPGYFIDLKGDSILCNIEYNDWNRNPKTIQLQVNGNLKEFSPAEIKGFGVFGYADYLSSSVSYHTNPVSSNDLQENFSDSTETKSCFLKVLNPGYYSLYSLVLPSGNYLFMSTPGKPITELVYRVRAVRDSTIEDVSYKKEILTMFMNEGLSEKYFNRINNATYSASDIGSLFRILNENHGGVQNHFKSNGEFQFGVFVGCMINTFPTTFDGKYATSNQFTPGYSASGGLNFLYSIPVHFKAFKIGASIGYNAYNRSITQSGSITHNVSAAYYYTTTYDETLTVQNSMLLTNIYFMYLINPLDKIKAYVKTGLNYNFSISGNIDVISTYKSTTSGIMNGNVPFQGGEQGSISMITLEKNYLAVLFSAGIETGRSRLEFSYWPPVNIAKPSGDILGGTTKPNFKIGSMALYYYFSLF